MRWYRIEVPPSCVAVVPPALHGAYRMLLNGREMHAGGSAPVDLRPGLRGEKNSLVIVARKDDPLTSPIQFVTGATPFHSDPGHKQGLPTFPGQPFIPKPSQCLRTSTISKSCLISVV
ncbi:MAG: hypothetical protein QOE55_7273 [Acidobacteriaceae bacterium]|jgi:hypothetical protein|nr:hypothetical protein [Acidobacteriaceae bacterium]